MSSSSGSFSPTNRAGSSAPPSSSARLPTTEARQEVVVAAITSNIRRRLLGDHLIADWKGAGLLFPSLVTGIYRTISRTMILRKLGAMARPDQQAVERAIRRSLGV